MSNEFIVKNGLILAGELESDSIEISEEITASGILPVDSEGYIGASGVPWKHIYVQNTHTGDIHMKNEDGNWTLKEQDDFIMAINNKTGKKYKVLLEEI